jgi:hypothetical protein
MHRPSDHGHQLSLDARVGPGPARQRCALDVAHGVIVLAVVLADFEDGHDMRVVQIGGSLGLGVEAGHVALGS